MVCADLEGAKKTGQTVYNDGSEQYRELKNTHWKNCVWNWTVRSAKRSQHFRKLLTRTICDPL